jgi:hypothetical protein
VTQSIGTTEKPVGAPRIKNLTLEWTVRARRPLYLVTTEVLRGLLQASTSAPFDLRGRSGSVRVVLDPVPVPEWYARLRDAFPGWAPRLPHRTELMFGRGREGPHWTATLRDGEAAYVAYELTRGDLTGFAGDVDALVGQRVIGQVLLDLRLNGGGDNTTYGPLLEVLERATHELGKRLRVLIGGSCASSSVDRRSPRRCSWSSISGGERRHSSLGSRRAAHKAITVTLARWCSQRPDSWPTWRP